MPETDAENLHPCLTCGACCAYFRASFYWAEADDAAPGGVPVRLTRKLNDHRRSMIGMDGAEPRCIALEGDIGKRVHCTIYENRSSVCRAFEPSWESGTHNERCDKARAAWGLQPLTPEDWRRFGSFDPGQGPIRR